MLKIPLLFFMMRIRHILKIINAKLEKPISLTAFNYFIFHADVLYEILKDNNTKT